MAAIRGAADEAGAGWHWACTAGTRPETASHCAEFTYPTLPGHPAPVETSRSHRRPNPLRHDFSETDNRRSDPMHFTFAPGAMLNCPSEVGAAATEPTRWKGNRCTVPPCDCTSGQAGPRSDQGALPSPGTPGAGERPPPDFAPGTVLVFPPHGLPCPFVPPDPLLPPRGPPAPLLPVPFAMRSPSNAPQASRMTDGLVGRRGRSCWN